MSSYDGFRLFLDVACQRPINSKNVYDYICHMGKAKTRRSSKSYARRKMAREAKRF